MTTLEEKTINEIKSRGIIPKKKSSFILREVGIWTLLYTGLLAVGIAMSVGLFLFLDADWEAFEDSDFQTYEKILHSIPFVWITICLVFLAIAYTLLLHTKAGYKKINWKFITGTFGALILIAIGLHFASIAEKVEENVSSVPYYENVVSSKRDLWRAPEKGMIAGKITAVQDERNFSLKDLRKNDWHILMSSITQVNSVEIEPNVRVKIVGRKISTSTFEAIEVRRW